MSVSVADVVGATWAPSVVMGVVADFVGAAWAPSVVLVAVVRVSVTAVVVGATFVHTLLGFLPMAGVLWPFASGPVFWTFFRVSLSFLFCSSSLTLFLKLLMTCLRLEVVRGKGEGGSKRPLLSLSSCALFSPFSGCSLSVGCLGFGLGFSSLVRAPLGSWGFPPIVGLSSFGSGIWEFPFTTAPVGGSVDGLSLQGSMFWFWLSVGVVSFVVS
jgi:hypothetical protein